MGTDAALSPLLTIAPTRRELGELGAGDERTRACVVGIGRAAGERAARLLDAAPCTLLVLLGYAGALDPDLHAGDLVLGNAYHHAAAPEIQGAPFTTRTAALLREAGLPALEGPVLTVDEPLLTPRAKRRARLATGALAVDMEGRWIAEVAASRDVPLIGIRAVLDEAHFSLPSFVATIVADSGRREWSHAVRALPRPSTIKSLLPLALKSRGASRALQRAVEIVLKDNAKQPLCE